MPLEEKLKQIDQEIRKKKLGKARDRLHGLISTYPNNLDLRDKLGEVYWKLNYPEMAGRYWFLSEPKSTRMATAIELFKESCGDDPLEILHKIAFKGNIDALDDELAKLLLVSHAAIAEEIHGVSINLNRQNENDGRLIEPFDYGENNSLLRNIVRRVGCWLAVILPIAIFAVGLYASFNWLLGFF